MTFTCNGICEKLETRTISTAKKYRNGQKRCTLCGVFFTTKNNRCPCCNVKLRTRPR